MSTFEERLAKLETQSLTYVQFKLDGLQERITELEAENAALQRKLGTAAVLSSSIQEEILEVKRMVALLGG